MAKPFRVVGPGMPTVEPVKRRDGQRPGTLAVVSLRGRDLQPSESLHTSIARHPTIWPSNDLAIGRV